MHLKGQYIREIPSLLMDRIFLFFGGRKYSIVVEIYIYIVVELEYSFIKIFNLFLRLSDFVVYLVINYIKYRFFRSKANSE